jgi:hypothetical protein
MVQYHISENEPLMRAAKKALETGDPNYILIWVPEEFENTLKNLVEKTFCENSFRKNVHDRSIDWYFESVIRLHRAFGWPHCHSLKSGESEVKKIITIVDRALECGDCEEINEVIPMTHTKDAKQRFHKVLINRNYAVNDIAAGRAYVSAFNDFIVYLLNIFSYNQEKSCDTNH